MERTDTFAAMLKKEKIPHGAEREAHKKEPHAAKRGDSAIIPGAIFRTAREKCATAKFRAFPPVQFLDVIISPVRLDEPFVITPDSARINDIWD